eukprot:3719463-Pleurochrysis_carterae.AAC.1
MRQAVVMVKVSVLLTHSLCLACHSPPTGTQGEAAEAAAAIVENFSNQSTLLYEYRLLGQLRDLAPAKGTAQVQTK